MTAIASRRVVRIPTALVVPTVVTALALLVRIVPSAVRGTLDRSFGFDESVYFFAAQQLAAGSLPYRDFQFVHPPGLLLGLTPLTGLARLTSDPVAMAVGEPAFALLGAACAGLVAWLLLRYGAAAAWFGGALYAVWSATVWGETMLLMGPVLGVFPWHCSGGRSWSSPRGPRWDWPAP